MLQVSGKILQTIAKLSLMSYIMKKTIDELKKELSKNPRNNSFQLLTVQEQDACRGLQGNNELKNPTSIYKDSPTILTSPIYTLKYFFE